MKAFGTICFISGVALALVINQFSLLSYFSGALVATSLFIFLHLPTR